MQYIYVVGVSDTSADHYDVIFACEYYYLRAGSIEVKI